MTNWNLALGVLVSVCLGHTEAHLYGGMLGGYGNHFPFMAPGYGYGNQYGGLGKYGYQSPHYGYQSPHYGYQNPHYGYKHLTHPYLSANYQGPFVGYGGKMYVPDPHSKGGHFGRAARGTHKIIIEDETKDSEDYLPKHHGMMGMSESHFSKLKDHPHGHIFRKIVEYDFSRAEPHDADMAAMTTDVIADHHVMKRRSVHDNDINPVSSTRVEPLSSAVNKDTEKNTEKRSLHNNIIDQVLYEISADDEDQPQKRGIYYYPKIIPYVPPVMSPMYYKLPQPALYKPAYYMPPYRKLNYFPAMGYMGRYRRDTQHDAPLTQIHDALTQIHDAQVVQHVAPPTQHDVPLTQQQAAPPTQQQAAPPTQRDVPPVSHVKSGGREFSYNFRAPQLHSSPNHSPHRTYHVLPHAKAADPTYYHAPAQHHHPQQYHSSGHDYHHQLPYHIPPSSQHHDFHGKAADHHQYQSHGEEAAPQHLLAAVNSQHAHDSGHHQQTFSHQETSPHHESSPHFESSPHHETSPNFESAPHHESSPNFESSPHHETPPHEHQTPVFQEPYYSGGYDDNYGKSAAGDVKLGHEEHHHAHEKSVVGMSTPTPSDSRMRFFHHLHKPLIHQHGHMLHSHHY